MKKETVWELREWVRGDRSGMGEVAVVVWYKGKGVFCRVKKER